MLKCDLQSMGGILSVSANTPIRVVFSWRYLSDKSVFESSQSPFLFNVNAVMIRRATTLVKGLSSISRKIFFHRNG